MPRQPAREYRVAIPSYQRAELLENTTLDLLLCRGVAPERITVFVHQHDTTLPQYRELSEHRQIQLQVEPTRGINAQRRAIARHYPPGTPVVALDDDVTDVVRAVDPKTLRPVTELSRWLQQAFTQTAAADLHVWGINAVVNPFFMRPGRPPSTGLKFLIGTMWGFYSRPGHPVHATTVEVKEDYEASLRAWWFDGGAVRFDDVAVKADHYRAPGGCQGYRDAAVSEQAAQQLIAEWPGLVRRNTKRQSGHAEVLLASKQRHAGKPTTAPLPGH